MNEIIIKPCPLCGKEVAGSIAFKFTADDLTSIDISCVCGLSFRAYASNVGEALELWNHREGEV